jgi:hypothetical protein
VEPLVYIKIHEAEGSKIAAICDKDLLGKRIVGSGLMIHVNEEFYGGLLVPVSVAMEKAEEAAILNLVGENAVSAAIKRGLVHPDAVIRIAGVPHAQALKMLY